MRMYRGQKKREGERKRDGRVKENWIADNGHDPRGQHLYIQHLLLRIPVKSSLKREKKKKKISQSFAEFPDDDRLEICWKEHCSLCGFDTMVFMYEVFERRVFSLWRNDVSTEWKQYQIKRHACIYYYTYYSRVYCICYLNWENTPRNFLN